MKSNWKLPGKPQASRVPTWLVLWFFCASVNQATSAEKTTVHIGTLPGVRYDIKRFDIRPGTQVELVFSNTDTMLHNLVIVKPGSRVDVVNAALVIGAEAIEKHFVPDSPNVLWATDVVAQGASFKLEFTAPSKTGDYPFVCTYPGHGFIMFGTMRVTDNPQEAEKNTGLVNTQGTHSAHIDKVFVKRTFMPDSGPASIAVHLTGGHSYCWDAGACRFRYAWKGGFVASNYPKPDKLFGEVYYREGEGFPFHLGNEKPQAPGKVRFLGYRLDASGIPEFDYSVDGVLLRERVEVQNDRLVRRFRASADFPFTLWYRVDPEIASQVDSSGKLDKGFYQFSGKDAAAFSITISPPSKAKPTAGGK